MSLLAPSFLRQHTAGRFDCPETVCFLMALCWFEPLRHDPSERWRWKTWAVRAARCCRWPVVCLWKWGDGTGMGWVTWSGGWTCCPVSFVGTLCCCVPGTFVVAWGKGRRVCRCSCRRCRRRCCCCGCALFAGQFETFCPETTKQRWGLFGLGWGWWWWWWLELVNCQLVPSRDVGWNRKEVKSKSATVGVSEAAARSCCRRTGWRVAVAVVAVAVASIVVASQTVVAEVATFVVDGVVRPWVSKMNFLHPNWAMVHQNECSTTHNCVCWLTYRCNSFDFCW